MTRPPREVKREEVREEDLEFYDAVVRRSRAPGRRFAEDDAQQGKKRYDYYLLLLHSPEMAYHLTQMGRLVRAAGLEPGSYSHYQREFVDQVLCPLLGTNLVLPTHIVDALAAGVRLGAIEALRYGRDEELTEDELLLATFVRQVSTTSMTDATWNSMEEQLGERGVVELMIFTGLLNMILRMQSALGMPEASDEEIDELIRGLKDGTREVGGFVDRSGSVI
jgi:alkylhydroperoxidase family enzyme